MEDLIKRKDVYKRMVVQDSTPHERHARWDAKSLCPLRPHGREREKLRISEEVQMEEHLAVLEHAF